MSLRYDLSKTGYSHLNEPERRERWADAQNVIWACIATDLGEITERNAREFYARYVMACRIVDADLDITPADVHMMIGLTTNIPSLTRQQFVAGLRQHLLAELNEGEREYLRNVYDA